MTLAVIIAAVILLVAYDIFAVFSGGPQNTISWKLMTWSQRFPIIPFVGGVLAGHWWWPQ